jgi:hypothetical protein
MFLSSLRHWYLKLLPVVVIVTATEPVTMKPLLERVVSVRTCGISCRTVHKVLKLPHVPFVPL